MCLQEGEIAPRLGGIVVGAGVTEGVTTNTTTTSTGGTQEQESQEEHDVEQGRTGLEEPKFSTLFHSQIRFHHLAAATGLIVTYVIEIIVQIFLVLYCCPSFIWVISTPAWWNWSSFLAASFLITSLVVTTVSIVWVCRGLDFAGRLCGRLLCYVMHSLLLGLLWRYLKLTFVYDRADVQEFVALRVFQVYFQSLPLTSIHLAWLISSRENWSSVSLGMILMEFVCIVTALILSSYIKSDEQEQRQQQQQQQQQQHIKSRSEVMQIIVKNLNCLSCTPSSDENEEEEENHCDSSSSMTKKQKISHGGVKEERKTTTKKAEGTKKLAEQSSFWPQLLETKLTILGRTLLLCSRIIVLGIIILHLKYWTCMFFLVHFMVSITWISFSLNNNNNNNNHHHHSHTTTASSSSFLSSSTSTTSSSSRNVLLLEQMEEVSLTKGKDYVTMISEWSYVLFWDPMSIPSSINLCTWILPVLLVLVENGIVVLFSWHHASTSTASTMADQDEDRPVTLTIISGICLLVGWLLFCSLTLVGSHGNGSSGRSGGGGGGSGDGGCNRSNVSNGSSGPSGDKVCNCCSPIPAKKDVKPSSRDKSQHQATSPSVIDPMMIKSPTANHHGLFVGDKTVNMFSSTDILKFNDKAALEPAAHFGIGSHLSLRDRPSVAFPNTYIRINEKLLPTMVKAATPTVITDEMATTTITTTTGGTRNNNNGKRLKEHSPEAVIHNTRAPSSSSMLLAEPIRNGRNNGKTDLVINQTQQSPVQVATMTVATTTTTTNWVSDTCCNDSNGSSNSRNTNTLRDNGSHIPDGMTGETDLDNSKFVFYFPATDHLTTTTTTTGTCSNAPNTFNTTTTRMQQQQNIHSHDRSSKNNTPLIGYPGCHQHHTHPHQDSGRKIKKKSRSSSISSFRNVRHYRVSSPVEIKQATRIPVYGPRMTNTVSTTNSASKDNSSAAATATGWINNNNNNQYQWDTEGDGVKSSCYLKDYYHGKVPHYEKLIEDSYGILICESEPSGETAGVLPVVCKARTNNANSPPMPPIVGVSNGSSKKLKVLCAKCLRNHDPLLSNCLDNVRTSSTVNSNNNNNSSSSKYSHMLLLGHASSSPAQDGRGTRRPSPLNPLATASSSLPRTPPITHELTNSNGEEEHDDDDDEEEYDFHDAGNNKDDNGRLSDTTEYPSETEMTCTLEEDEEEEEDDDDEDQHSVSTSLSTATYTTWPHQSQPNLSMWTTSTMMPHSRFPKEFTSLEYVRAWLLTSQARLRHQQQQQQQQRHHQNRHQNHHCHHHHHHNHHHHQHHQASADQESRTKSAKRVYRSHTLTSQNRKVRFVNSVMTEDSHQATRSSRGRRYDPQASTTSPTACRSSSSAHLSLVPSSSAAAVEAASRGTSSVPPTCPPTSLSLSFQPPPRQKQHPILPPHSVIPHQKNLHRVHTGSGNSSISHTNNSNNNTISNNFDNTITTDNYISAQNLPTTANSVTVDDGGAQVLEQEQDSFHKELEIIL